MQIAGKHDTRCLGHVLKFAAPQLRWATRPQCARSALAPLRVRGGPFDLGPSAIYAAIDDPDALHECTVAAGAEVVMGLTDQEDGSREFAGATCGASALTAPAPEPALASRRLGSRQAEFIRPARFTAASRFARHMTACLRLRVPHRPSAAATQGELIGFCRCMSRSTLWS